MNHLVIGVLLTGLFLVRMCAGSVGTPSPTAAPSPTTTPVAIYTPKPSRTATPTPGPTPNIYATTLDDAIRLWKPVFNVHGSTLHIAHVDSASWVETTRGQARLMFEPLRPTDGTEDDSAPVWVIVAYGQFQPGTRAITNPTPGVFTTAWAAVVEGGIGGHISYSNAQYDLSVLGTQHELDPAILNGTN